MGQGKTLAAANSMASPANRHIGGDCRNPDCMDSLKIASMALDARTPSSMTAFSVLPKHLATQKALCPNLTLNVKNLCGGISVMGLGPQAS